jgi:hypothetical protein
MKTIDMTQYGPFFVALWVALIIFGCVIQPVWCIVDCALDKTRSKTSTIIWVIVLFFTTCFAGFFYGVLAARSQHLRLATIGSVLGLLLSFGSFLYLAVNQNPQPVPKKTKSKATKTNKPKPLRKPTIQPTKK